MYLILYTHTLKIAIKVMLKQKKTHMYEGKEQKADGLSYFSSSSMREFGASSTHHWESFNGYEGNEAIKSESFIKIYWAR